MSSKATVTFYPFGVAIEYSCRACLPLGKALTDYAPAVGLLILAKAFFGTRFRAYSNLLNDDLNKILQIVIKCAIKILFN
jgi:hypothetical protein